MFLTRPRAIYKDSFISAVAEFQKEGLELKYDINSLRYDFETLIQELRDKEQPKKDNIIPETILWLIDNSQYIGRISIRQKLNERLLKYEGNIGYEIRPSKRGKGYGREILRLGLIEAKALGMAQVLISCDADNIASKRIIEANGGVFENEIYLENGQGSILRYWKYFYNSNTTLLCYNIPIHIDGDKK